MRISDWSSDVCSSDLLDGDKEIDVLGCDETDKCLNPGKRTIPALGATALRPRVAMLIQSMSDKVRSNAALTTEEKNLLGVASIPLYKVVAVQAASGLNLSPGELNSIAEAIGRASWRERVCQYG